MVAKTATRTRTLRAIKDQFLIHKTAKDAKPLDEMAELAILKRMLKQRNESATQYQLAGREDLYAVETTEAAIIKEFIPETPTEDEIDDAVLSMAMKNGWIDSTGKAVIPKKSMGLAVKQIKERYPSADGKVVADTVKFYLEQ